MNRAAKGSKRQRARGAPAATASFQRLDLGRRNWILFGVGIASILLGFVLLSTGDITLAPILLVAGYIVFIPWALVARNREKPGTEPPQA